MTKVVQEAEIKQRIFERYPDLMNLRPLGWTGGSEVPTNKIIGVAVVARMDFDGWRHLPVRDSELRELAWNFLFSRPSDGRHRCTDADAILCLVIKQ